MAKNDSSFSPAWCENKLENILNSLSQKISNIPYFLFIPLCLILSLGSIVLMTHTGAEQWWIHNNPFGYSFLGFHWPAILVLVAIAIIKPFVRLPFNLQLAFLIIAYATAAPLNGASLVSVSYGFFLAYIVPLAVLFLLRQHRLFIQAIAQIVLVVVCMTVLNATSGWTLSDGSDRGWWAFRPERYMMVILLWLTWSKVNQKDSSYLSLINPLHLVYPLPAAPQLLTTQLSQSKHLNKNGIATVFISVAAFMSAGFVPRDFQSSLLVGFSSYIYFYLNSWAVLNLIVGLGQSLGYPLQAPFHFALFATSPAESWRRWNIPFYQWFRGLVFGPLLRRTNSLFLAITGTFAVSFWLHDGFGVIHVWHNSAASLGEDPTWLKNKIIFFGLHAIGVYVALKFSKFIPKTQSRVAWVAVVATVLWLSLVHWFVRYS